MMGGLWPFRIRAPERYGARVEDIAPRVVRTHLIVRRPPAVALTHQRPHPIATELLENIGRPRGMFFAERVGTKPRLEASVAQRE
jgi:hypothetical protein